ncbi:hypothetical protein NIES21_30710 [Anabaenopsis circularis NIES-21]|uniref:Uncharacterized protein n=2 Tax=Nostocales TaxID=1161 RepID=A0A1Z4GIS2_9CYAN|nr:hypothetical protein [Nostoc cycadae]BAY17236.1 hypothetical protein NIES21_30710 [Anabaenopsis circularis NIES-21]GBE91036.1 alpha/beta fold family hydrolase [Nostoc cycadae WK-1]
MANEKFKKAVDSSERAEVDTYDRGIVPAETAARKKREGELYKTLPTEQREADAPTDDQTDAESIHTTDGYTVDKEGLLNNYAIEPEMYYEVPGDARQEVVEDTAQRVEELQEVKEDKEGELTEKGDERGRGPGIV